MPLNKPHFVSVDRVEGVVALLEADDGRRFEVPATSFAIHPREGMIYRVPLNEAGEPDWSHAVPDPLEADRRRGQMKAKMDALRSKDDGKDLKL